MNQGELIGVGADPLDLVEHSAVADVDEKQWAPLLVDMLRVVEALKKRRGKTDAEAHVDAQATVLAIAEYFGGRMVYLPKGDRLKTALRDAEIWNAYDGRNVPALAKKYRMSEIHCYAVIAKQRALHQRKLQGRLFED